MICRVLIAEDDQDIREALADFLDSEGFRITTVCDGIEALQAAIHQQPDVNLLDHRMPGMEGLEVARLLLQQGAPVRIIFVSAARDIRGAALALGCCFISKPYDLDLLLTHLSKVCKEIGTSKTI